MLNIEIGDQLSAFSFQRSAISFRLSDFVKVSILLSVILFLFMMYCS